MVSALRRSLLVSAVAGALALPPTAVAAAIGPPAIIDNGTIELGIQPEGNLIVGSGGLEDLPTGRGLRYLPNDTDGLDIGCDCEGWGVADVGSGLTGHASEHVGNSNISVVDFASTESTATSVVVIPAAPAQVAGGSGSPTFRVTHSFTPADETPYLYRVNVHIENTSAIGATDVRYRRLMDWDVEPTPRSEFVTNEPGDAANVIHVSNDGFDTPNPLEPNTPTNNSGNIGPYGEGRLVDFGPTDQGALWDFSFGPLAAGAANGFSMFYGAAPTEEDAFGALEAVRAEAFGFGQANTDRKPNLPFFPIGDRSTSLQGGDAGPVRPASEVDGTPATFIAAFQGVGGQPIFGSVYVMVAKDGGVFAPGGRGFHGTAAVRPGEGILRDAQGRIIGASGSPLDSPVVAFAYTSSREGYWLVQANGGVIPIGDAPDVGDLRGVPLRSPIVGAAATNDVAGGLYVVAADGGVFALGTAPFMGSLGGTPLNKPIVDMDVDGDGEGYYLVASDGGVFAFKAVFRGSLGGTPLNRPIVGIAMSRLLSGDPPPPQHPDSMSTSNYVLAADDGGVFAFGAPFAGSLGGIPLAAPIVGIAADPDDRGYWLAGADGGAFAFDADFSGSVAPILLNAPISGIAAL